MKFGLCIGLNYKDTENELNGCIPDVHKMGKMLESNGFKVELLTDSLGLISSDTVLSKLNNLVSKVNDIAQSSKVVIHYSGHGAFIPDNNNDESDGRDEVICIGNSEFITDDQLHKIIKKFKIGTRVFCMFDCCHSGTILDLKYRENVIENRKSTISNDVVCISGCKDPETSSDIVLNGVPGGALTLAFLSSFRLNFEIINFVNVLRWKTKEFNQCPVYTHSVQKGYNLDHFF
jgi:hypothetical protein